MTAGWVAEGVVELGGFLFICDGVLVQGIDLEDFSLHISV